MDLSSEPVPHRGGGHLDELEEQRSCRGPIPAQDEANRVNRGRRRGLPGECRSADAECASALTHRRHPERQPFGLVRRNGTGCFNLESRSEIGWFHSLPTPMLSASRQEARMARFRKTLLPATFNRLAWSNLAAQSAEQIALAAAPIVAVLVLGAGEGFTGMLQTALTLPFILFAIPAGLLADRISRRWLMAGSEALRAIALLAILILIWLGSLTLPLLALSGFVAVCGTVAYSVAAPALVPSMVSPQSLPAANARIELARTIAFASGPALGGVLVGWVGAAPAFGFAAALSVIAVVLLS